MTEERVSVVFSLLLLYAVLGPAFAQTKNAAAKVFPGQTEGDFIAKGLHFNSGEVLPELRLHVTLGTAHPTFVQRD